MNSYSIAIHGGAGTILKNLMTPEKEMAYRNGLKAAIECGEAILKSGGSAFDAVEAAVIELENNELFNAGKGAVFTHNGLHELDASIMTGYDLRAGAIAGVQNIKNPISLARAVMEKSEHVLLTGNGAIEFAKSVNARFETDEYFYVQLRYDQLQEAKKANSMVLDHTINITETGEKKFGTVGCVAMDTKGNLAAGTSTGGMTNKKYGRVGDSSIIGSGTYANNKTCAVSCTGHGELFMRSVVAYDISCLMEYKNLSLKEACDIVVMDKLVKIGGEGGLVALDSAGNIELAFNSDGMYRASKKHNDSLYIGIYK
jgi:beta-aspartyl-peptidase (threonine type)